VKSSFYLGAFLPTALALGAFMGCARANSRSVERLEPRAQATLTSEDIDRAPGVSIEQLLATRVPGLSLSRARDGHIMLQLRGQSTLAGDQEALIVVNGVALGNSYNFSAINRHDIAYIQVVKDGADLALYGVRGANGVIVVATKNGAP
jgi:TonB-dependent SusC/RagA subfamily outer membrane receptor